MDALSDEEFEWLDDRLVETPGLEQGMDLCMLDGFLAALVCAPELLAPERWIRWVWDCQDGRAQPDFADEAEAREVFGLVLRHWQAIDHQLREEPQTYEPVLMEGVVEVAATAGDSAATAEPPGDDADVDDDAPVIDEWCAGFLLGMAQQAPAWQAFEQAHPGLLDGVRLYGVVEDLDMLHRMRLPYAEHCAAASQLAGVVSTAYRWFAAQRAASGADARGIAALAALGGAPVRHAARVGRNDPCPCGSGRKFKHCAPTHDVAG